MTAGYQCENHYRLSSIHNPQVHTHAYLQVYPNSRYKNYKVTRLQMGNRKSHFGAGKKGTQHTPMLWPMSHLPPSCLMPNIPNAYCRVVA